MKYRYILGFLPLLVAACGQASGVSAPIPIHVIPSPTSSSSSGATVTSLAIVAAQVIGDHGAQSVPVAVAAKDQSGKAISGTIANPVSVAVNDPAGHTLLSLDNGATKAAKVVATSSTALQNLHAYYDGAGGSGYVASLSASASGVTPAGNTLSSLTTTATVGFGSPSYAQAAAAFSAPSQQLRITAREPNFSGSFTISNSTCGGIAGIAVASPTITVTSSAFGTCSFAISDGTLAYTVAVTSNVTSGSLVIPPPSGTIDEYVDPTSLSPVSIAVGSDGNLWYVGTSAAGQKLGRITTAGAITDFALPAGSPTSIASGSDGNLWVTDAANNSVYRITTAGAVNGTLPAGSAPSWIAAGPDGALWIADSGDSSISCLTTTGSRVNYPITGASSLTSISGGPDGALWFTDSSAGFVGRIVTPCGGSGAVSRFPIGTGSGASGIVAGPDGALWFSEFFGGTAGGVGRISLSGAYSSYPVPDTLAGGAVTRGPDGALWFASCSCGLGRSTTGGAMLMVNAGISATPVAVVAGPDGGIWFAESNGRIGRLQP